MSRNAHPLDRLGKIRVARSSTTFVKGQSGNPRARPHVCFEIRDADRKYGPACIASLAQLAGIEGRGATNEAVRAAAMKELLDRGYGRPVEMVSEDGDAPLIVDFRWADNTPMLLVAVRFSAGTISRM
jgi:hypothetical protein